MEGLTIGKIARSAGVGVETIRFYEREGLVPEPPRSASGYRKYPREAVERLRFIRRAKELGFSLKEVEELIALRLDPESDRSAVREAAERKRVDIRARIADLQDMERAIGRLTAACDGHGAVAGCPILEALSGTTSGAESEQVHGSAGGRR